MSIAGNNEVVESADSKTNKKIIDSFKSKNNKSEKLTHMPNIEAIKKLIFLTLDAKKTFNYLRQAFIKALILQHFNLKCYIQIETDTSSHAIGKVLSQLNFDVYAPPNNLNKSDFSQ